ncbi:MAG: chemotaxis protein CheB [Candidatus Nanohaloarchaea archaeon]
MLKVAIAHPEFERRRQISREIGQEDDIEVVGVFHRPTDVFEALKNRDIDVLLLGVNFGQMSGLDVLEEVMDLKKIPTVMILDDADVERREAVKAFSYGAVDFITPEDSAEDKRALLRAVGGARVKEQVESRIRKEKESPDFSQQVVVIGASTGGPPEIEFILKNLPGDLEVPVLVVQHMSGPMVELFANRLDSLSELDVRLCSDSERLGPGQVWISRSEKDMKVERRGEEFFLVEEESDSEDIASVNATFRSVAEVFGTNAVGVILSGMGRDGAVGTRFLSSAGGKIIVQDRDTSLIFGMGQQVIRQGDADYVVPLEKIPEKIMELT